MRLSDAAPRRMAGPVIAAMLVSSGALAADPWESYYKASPRDLPLDQITFIKDHNSYDRGGKLVDRLNYTAQLYQCAGAGP